MFEHKEAHKCTWYQSTLRRRSMIDFVIVSADLRPHVLDTRVKRGAELSTVDHGGQGSCPTEEGGLQGYASPGDSGGSCRVPSGPKGCSRCRVRGKAAGVGEVWRSYGEGLSVGTKMLLENRSAPQKGKTGTIQAVYSKDGTLLTSTDDVIGRWKEHFEELLNPTYTPSSTEAELEADGGSSSVSLGKSLR
ncbi:hypothetical protein DPEC_G00000780 [Dallia pectoralis]|uniref:Uncharacterized protein n=1 Tax=Dallia pectoralis TaxID=75939 RepID=A0ACC2HJ20_DALPE|nr:hypothetical protein DPEC_G00000780 [Dallia pectoralis]